MILIIGLMFELFITLTVISKDKDQLISINSEQASIERVVSLINVLDKTPTSLHREIINASQSSGFLLSLDKSPLVSEGTKNINDRLNAQLSSIPHEFRIHSSRQPNQSMMSDSEHQKMMRHHNMMMGSSHSEMMNSSQSMGNMMRDENFQVELTASIKLNPNHWLNISTYVNPDKSQWSLKAHAAIGLVALMMLIAVYITLKKALKPIKNLGVAAQQFAQQRDVVQLPENGPIEILPTIDAFNQMQIKLAQFIDDQRKMLAAISHDLKTPITTMRLRLEFFPDNNEKQKLLATVDQMDAMLKATLNFSRASIEQESFQKIEITSFLHTICDDFQDKGHQIDTRADQKSIATIQPISFRRMIENLVNNAIHYAQPKDEHLRIQIKVSQQTEINQLTIQVCDNGQGIPDAMLDEVLKPFVRLDKARDTQTGNVGLGLSICQSIVQSHNGKLMLTNQNSGGLCVTIYLPSAL